MVKRLRIVKRSVHVLRNNVLVHEEALIASRTPLYYLDLPDPNGILFKQQFENIFPESYIYGPLKTLNICVKPRMFYPDDSSVGCKARKDSFLSYTSATSTEKELDTVGISTFFIFLHKGNVHQSLTRGESALRFLNFATLCGYEHWREEILFDYIVGNVLFPDIYPSILKGIYKKKYEHPLLVKKFWDVFCGTLLTRLELFRRVPDAEHLKFMLEVANRVKFDFWDLRRNGGAPFTKFLIENCIQKNRCDLVIMMLKYGFTLGTNTGETIGWQMENLLTQSSLRFTFKELIPEGFMVWFLARCYANCPNLLELPGFVELYQKLSRSCSLPSLPPSIVRKNLEKVLSPLPSSRLAVEEMTFIYEVCEVHPADGSVVPLLSHLSRCVIRERLAANYQLPTAIDDFQLPEIIKCYLRLDH